MPPVRTLGVRCAGSRGQAGQPTQGPETVLAAGPVAAQLLDADSSTTTVSGADHLLPLLDPASLAGIAAAFVTMHRIPANV
jgi:hypothetical protein